MPDPKPETTKRESAVHKVQPKITNQTTSPFEAFSTIEALLQQTAPHLLHFWEIRHNASVVGGKILDELLELDRRKTHPTYRQLMGMVAAYMVQKYDVVLQLYKTVS